MSIFRDFFVKEKPVFTGITRGVGGFGFGKSAAGGGGGGGSSMSASGGDLNAETTPDGNTYHVFYNPGTLTVSGGGQCDILLVGGGASGRGGHGPGGAGGQVILYESETLSAGSYPITVGDGGAASPPQGINPGNNTTGFTYTAYGAGLDPGIPPNIPAGWPGFAAMWGPGPEYGNVNSPSFGSPPGPTAGVGAAGAGGSPSSEYRPGGDGRQVPVAFLPTNAPASLISALGSTPAPSPAWRYFGGGGGQGGGNGFETSQGGNGGLGGGGGAGTGPGGPGGVPGYGYPFTPGGPLGDAGQDRRGGGGGGGGIGACGSTYCPAKKGGDGVVVVRYST
tara:strand:+ start:174 stop:1181 length:1008 start_codon:yes stop_codon:yes gene_type:complete